ncbi:MAG: hypothetical protein ACI8PZ_003668 [Myxococcota bacterium]|jgi:hypothetical protein
MKQHRAARTALSTARTAVDGPASRSNSDAVAALDLGGGLVDLIGEDAGGVSGDRLLRTREGGAFRAAAVSHFGQNWVPEVAIDLLTQEALRQALRDLQSGLPPLGAVVYVDRAVRAAQAIQGALDQENELDWYAWGSTGNDSDGDGVEESWSMEDTEVRDFLLGRREDPGNGRMNCWESVLVGAWRGGALSLASLRELFQGSVAEYLAGGEMWVALRERVRGGPSRRMGEGQSPLPGDILDCEDGAHVMLALAVDGDDVTVFSLWGQNGGRGWVAALDAVLDKSGSSPADVEFFTPRWG